MQTNRPRKLTGRIISFGAANPTQESWVEHEDVAEEMPFRPAFDLLDAQAAAPSPEELAAIGLALCNLIPNPDASRPASWGQAGIFESAGRGGR